MFLSPGYFGHIEEVNDGPSKARQPIGGINSTMVGTGFTMEGLDLTYLTVDLVSNFFMYKIRSYKLEIKSKSKMSEMSWQRKPYENLPAWIDEYTCRRYGDCIPELAEVNF